MKLEGYPCMLTEEEFQLAKDLGEIWNRFLKIDIVHPSDQAEMANAIHKCQNIILSRPAVRVIKEITNES